jgi:threonine/homoserine/homoserine lactone efflux protein
MLLSKSSFKIGNPLEDKSSAILIRGIFVNLLNPKLTLFFFSFFPQYISPNSSDYTVKSLLYGFVFMLLTFIIFIGYGALAGTTRNFIIGSPKRMDIILKIFGIIIIFFAIQLSLSSI